MVLILLEFRDGVIMLKVFNTYLITKALLLN